VDAERGILSPRETILGLADALELVPLKGVADAYVRKLSVAQAETLRKDGENSSVRLFVRAVCDEKGEPLFTDKDVEKLKRINAVKFGSMVQQCMTFNGMTQESAEDLEKNSEPAPSGD